MSASIKSTPDLKDLPYTSLFACFHNVQSWYIYFIALKHLFHSLHLFVSPRLSDFHIVIVQISGEIFAFDHTIRSYVDFMDLHSSSNVKWGQKGHGWTCIDTGGVKEMRAILQCHWTHL